MNLLYFDLYGFNPTMLYRQRKKFKTYLGLFLTFLTALVFVLLLGISLHELVAKSKPQVIQSEKVDIDPSKFEFNGDNFIFLGALEYANTQFYLDESVYSLRMFQNIHFMNAEGTYNITQKPINVKKCSEIESDLLKETFARLPLEFLYCSDPTEKFEIQGIFGSPTYISLSVNIKRCDPSERKCKSQAEIDEIIEGGYFGFVVSDVTFEPLNAKAPFKKYPANFFTTIGNNEFKFLNLTINKNVSQTDFGLLTEDLTEIADFSLDSFSETVQVGKFENIIWLNFFFSNKTKHFDRFYAKIQRIAAEVGAITKLFVIGFSWFTRFIGEKHLYVKIYEELSFFNKKAKRKLNLGKNSKTEEKTNIQVNSVPNNKTNFLFTGLFCCKSKASRDFNVMKEKFKVIKEKLNVTSFLKLQADLEILRNVLLEPYQLRLLQKITRNTDSLSLLGEKGGVDHTLAEEDIVVASKKSTNIDERIYYLIQDK